jgi:plastocyanin
MLTQTPKVVISTAVLVVALGIIVATFGGGTTGPDRDGRLEVVLEGNQVTPARMTVPAGEPVTFVFVNQDNEAHNLTFGRDVPDAQVTSSGFTEDLLDGLSARVEPPQAWIVPSDRVPSVTIHVAPRASTTVTLTFPEDRVGEWELACFRGRGCVPREPRAGLTIE